MPLVNFTCMIHGRQQVPYSSDECPKCNDEKQKNIKNTDSVSIVEAVFSASPNDTDNAILLSFDTFRNMASLKKAHVEISGVIITFMRKDSTSTSK